MWWYQFDKADLTHIMVWACPRLWPLNYYYYYFLWINYFIYLWLSWLLLLLTEIMLCFEMSFRRGWCYGKKWHAYAFACLLAWSRILKDGKSSSPWSDFLYLNGSIHPAIHPSSHVKLLFNFFLYHYLANVYISGCIY